MTKLVHRVFLFFYLSCQNSSTLLANAWEEEDEVILITCRIENPDIEMLNGAVKEKVESFRTELYGSLGYIFVLA